MIRTTLTAGLVGLALSVSGAGAQEREAPEEPAATFPAEIEQVTVDVVVVDEEGQPVQDLTEADMEVYEDGERQTITSFDTFEVAAPPEEPLPAPPGEPDRAPAPPPRSRVSTNTDADQRQGRTFMIVFDDVHLTAGTAARARAATRRFVDEETAEGDRITLVAPGAGVWWNARIPEGRDELVDVLEDLEALYVPDTARDRLSDYEAMRIHNFRDYEVLNRVQRRYATYQIQTVTDMDPHTREFRNEEDPYITAKAAETYYAATARNHVTLGAIERGIESLVRLQGRKSLILVSEGFVYDIHLPEFRRIVTASRRANTAIYFLNSRGLEALPMEMSADMGLPLPQEDIGFSVFSLATERAGGSESLAKDTGGFTVRNSNDLAEGFKRIGDETRAYYLIGYNPTNTARDGKFRKIEVKIPGRKGLTVRARRGYYAPTADDTTVATTEGRDPEFQSALDSPYETDDIPLRMTHYVREETFLGTARVYVAAEVDLRGLRFEKEDGLDVGALEFLLVAIDRRTREFHRYDQKMDLKLPPETHDLLNRTWLPIVRDFELASGPYRAKLVVRDKNSERIGTVIHDFDVPDTAGFRVSTPVLSDMRETTPEGLPGDRLAIMARREFSPEASLFCQLDVYRPIKLASSGMPRVTMAYEVRRSDGQLYTREPRSLILPTSEGALSRIIGFPLEVAPPGDYELVMSVKDELSGKTIDLREPFTVSASAAAPPSSTPPEPPTPASAAPAETTGPTGRR
jgi:VWFA-related protein